MRRLLYVCSLALFTGLCAVAINPAAGQMGMQSKKGGMGAGCCCKGTGQTPGTPGANAMTPGGPGLTFQTPFGNGGGMQVPQQPGGGMFNPMRPKGGMQIPQRPGGGMQNPLGPNARLQIPIGQGMVPFQNPMQQQPNPAMQNPLLQTVNMRIPQMSRLNLQTPLPVPQSLALQNPLQQPGTNYSFSAPLTQTKLEIPILSANDAFVVENKAPPRKARSLKKSENDTD